MAKWRKRIVGIAASVVALFVLYLIGSAIHLFPQLRNPFGETTTERSGPVVLKSIVDLSKYEAASGNFQVVVDITSSGILPRAPDRAREGSASCPRDSATLAVFARYMITTFAVLQRRLVYRMYPLRIQSLDRVPSQSASVSFNVRTVCAGDPTAAAEFLPGSARLTQPPSCRELLLCRKPTGLSRMCAVRAAVTLRLPARRVARQLDLGIA